MPIPTWLHQVQGEKVILTKVILSTHGMKNNFVQREIWCQGGGPAHGKSILARLSPRSNISREEARVLKELREEKSGSSIQWTRGWLWWYWTNMTTSTRPRTYFLTRTHTDSLQEIPPPNIKTNLLKFFGLLRPMPD